MEPEIQEESEENEEEESEVLLPTSSSQDESQKSPSSKGDDFMNTKSEEVATELHEYIINIPSTACRQDLVDLKTYLEGVPSGSIRVFIDIQGQIKDTKIAVKATRVIEGWMKTKGWEEGK